MAGEPWRYACPDCGSVSLRKNNPKSIHARRRDPDVGKWDAGGTPDDYYESPPQYRCKVCGSGFEEPIDKKEERVPV